MAGFALVAAGLEDLGSGRGLVSGEWGLAGLALAAAGLEDLRTSLRGADTAGVSSSLESFSVSESVESDLAGGAGTLAGTAAFCSKAFDVSFGLFWDCAGDGSVLIGTYASVCGRFRLSEAFVFLK